MLSVFSVSLGVLLALGAGLMFAGYALSVRHFMHGMHPVVAFAAKWWIGLGIALLTLVAWAMGRYMIIVRRAEFAHHVRDAEAELAAARRNAGSETKQEGDSNG
jgi:drug/metabolite transporter (DMT)-like permease